MADGDEQEDLPPELREIWSRTVLGRGLLRMRGAGGAGFWNQHREHFWLSRLLGVVGAIVVYRAIVGRRRVPVIRRFVAAVAGVYSMGIWWALYGFACVFIVGLRKEIGSEDNPPE